jgi:RNA polymerase sigma factor (sigma-70 family)
MELIDRLRIILEAPGDDEDVDDIIDSEPEVEEEDADVKVNDDAEAAADEEKSEVEKLIYKEKGVTDWTGIPNPMPGKTLNDLKGSKVKGIPAVKLPLQNGWTKEEVISALKPTIIHFAKKYSTPTFSVEEAIAEQMTGVLEALRTDKGIAPFTSHVYRWLSTSAQRGAGKASNISGVPQTKGGKYDHLAASRAAVSADVPMPGETEETYSSQIASHYDQASELAGKQRSMTKLISHFLNAPSVGLSEKEKLVLMATYGIGPDGKIGEPKTSKEIADSLGGISVVRISQIRTGALAKIQEYVQARKFKDEGQAAQALGIEESKLLAIAEAFVRIITETIKLEYEIYSERQIIETKTNYRGRNESIKIYVNSDTYEVENALNEENESVLGHVTNKMLNEAIDMAKTKTSSQYFAEMVNNVIGMQAQPVLATINNTISKGEIPFIYVNKPGVERAMGAAEKAVFGNRFNGKYYGGGASRMNAWYYPNDVAEQVNKMHEIMANKGFAEFKADYSGKTMSEDVDRAALKPGSYSTEVSVPYLDGSGSTTYNVVFDIYGQFLEELDIKGVDDVDTGEMNVDLVTVNLDEIEKKVNEKIKSREIKSMSYDKDRIKELQNAVANDEEHQAKIHKFENQFADLQPSDREDGNGDEILTAVAAFLEQYQGIDLIGVDIDDITEFVAEKFPNLVGKENEILAELDTDERRGLN